MATDIIARGMITEYKSGTNIDFKENEDGSVTISASGDVSSEDTVARDTIDNHKLDKNNPHNVTAEQVGLGNVNNTADLDKPISTAVQTALNDKANTKHTHKKSDITDFPNSLPANGGNADTVDGFDIAEYVTTLPEGEYYTEVARINTRHKKIESCDTSNLKVGLADYATNADHAMNAGTVNNHTVDSDVPANAVFTDTTNSDVTIVGNPVQIDGLQGGVPFSEITVSGKNLIPFPYIQSTKTVNGITFTDNEDGTITANGTATAEISFALVWKNIHIPKGTYAISGCPEGGNLSTGFYIVCGTDVIRFSTDVGNGGTFTISEDTNDFTFSIRINSGVTVDNVVFRPQLELGDTATYYEPPITSQEVTITRCGKNLLNVYIPTKREYVVNNTTFTINDDGSVTAVSAETETAATRLSLSMTCPPGDYMFSGSADKDFCTYIYNRTKNTVTAWANPNPVPCRIEKENEYVLYFMVRQNGKANGNVCKPQLELGDTATEYEPYHADTISITPTFNPYTIQNDLLQYNDINTLIASIGELKVVGVQKNAAVKKVWDEITEVEHNADSMQSEITALGNVNAEGTLVVLDDLQGGVPFSEITVSGKNLLTYPYNETTKTVNGITFTDNGDGTITVNGTATANATFSLSSKIVYKSGVDYVISGCPNGGDRKFKIKGNSDGVNADDVGYGKTFSFSEDTECSVSILIYKDVTVENLIFRPQIELGATPTAYEPPITGRELTLAVSGKNLINNIQATGTVVGVTVTKNDDGTVTINGTTTGDLWLLFDDKCRVVKDKTYTFSMGFDASVGIMFGVRSGDNAQSYLSTGISGSFVAPVTGICRIRGYAKSGITFDNLTIYPQLEIGSTATPYEPYNGTEYNITPDNNPYVIPNDIRQQEGYNVISVSEGELSVVGVRKNAAIKRIWDDMSMDLLFDGTVTTGTNCITDNVNGYNFLYFYGNLSSVSGESGNVTGSLVIPKTARAILAGQSLVVTTGVIYITVNIINIESGVMTFTITPSDSSREIYEFKVFGIK